MKVVKTGKRYINAGLIPKNEYDTSSPGKNTDAAAVLAMEPKPDDAAHKQRLSNQQALRLSGRKNIHGWTRLGKINGWRAEAASLDDECTGMARYADDVREKNRLHFERKAGGLHVVFRMNGAGPSVRDRMRKAQKGEST